MLEKISYICAIISTLLAIWQYIRAEKYKKLYNQQFSNNTNFACRDVNNAQGDITINNGN
jgi:hypothetical protein